MWCGGKRFWEIGLIRWCDVVSLGLSFFDGGGMIGDCWAAAIKRLT